MTNELIFRREYGPSSYSFTTVKRSDDNDEDPESSLDDDDDDDPRLFVTLSHENSRHDYSGYGNFILIA